jgi:hypothetical protein
MEMWLVVLERRVLKKMFGHENYDVTASRRGANNEKPCVIEWSIYEG